jgi:hypothetical protein
VVKLKDNPARMLTGALSHENMKAQNKEGILNRPVSAIEDPGMGIPVMRGIS